MCLSLGEFLDPRVEWVAHVIVIQVSDMFLRPSLTVVLSCLNLLIGCAILFRRAFSKPIVSRHTKWTSQNAQKDDFLRRHIGYWAL
jgi:hypothetical protein